MKQNVGRGLLQRMETILDAGANERAAVVLGKALVQLLCHDAKSKGLDFDDDYWFLYDDVFSEKSIASLKPTDEVVDLTIYSNTHPNFRLKEIDDIRYVKCILEHTYEKDKLVE